MMKTLGLFRAIRVPAGRFAVACMLIALAGTVCLSIRDSWGQDAPRYCSGSAVANANSSLPEPILQVIRQRCKVGDTIMVDATQLMVIGRACDFGKTIVNNGRHVLCVFADDRGSR